MSSTPVGSEDHLCELLLQLKKTTPAEAREILNSQPQIAYALIQVMIKMNAINADVFQHTLASYGSGSGPQRNGSSSVTTVPAQAPPNIPLAAVPPAAAIPPHLAPHQRSRSNTPQFATPPPTHAQLDRDHGTPIQPSRTAPIPQAQVPPGLPSALASMTEEQRAVIMQILAMTPEQIASLPPTERGNIMQLRASLGLP